MLKGGFHCTTSGEAGAGHATCTRRNAEVNGAEVEGTSGKILYGLGCHGLGFNMFYTDRVYILQKVCIYGKGISTERRYYVWNALMVDWLNSRYDR